MVILPLENNPTLENYVKNNTENLRSVRTNDTLSLPFFDDFAKNLVYPDADLWIDNDVFINQSFGNNPPSIGVATFDALNATGKIQSNASSQGFISDYLTSKPIDILNYTGTNPISIYTSHLFYFETATGIYRPADSLVYSINADIYNCFFDSTLYYAGMRIFYHFTEVTDSLYTYNSVSGMYEHIDIILHLTNNISDSLYLSFYYQPQGITLNEPEANDSLVLEFKNSSGNWVHAWSHKGTALVPFTQVMIPVRDTSFIYRGFQFRFYNYASIGENVVDQQSFIGNVDIWNIDYVRLNKNRSMQDTVPDDVTFVNNLYSCLKDYSAVPWNHYKSTPGFQIDTLRFFYRNLSDSIKNVQRSYNITNKTTNSLIFNHPMGNENLLPHSDYYYKYGDTSKYFPSTADNVAHFEVQVIQKSGSSVTNRPYYWNDTIRFYQRFSNYYAYDDGTPEFGAGLAGGNTYNAKLACKFYPLKADTLRGAYIFFNRSLNNANIQYFYLAVWNASNGKPSSLIYKSESVKPDTASNTLNQFHYYSLDTAIYISDTFFIGWIQTTEDMLNIGVDRNYDASSKVLYNIYGYWQSMPYSGTLMIRPVMSAEPYVSVPENKKDMEIKIYPNPASDIIHIEAPDNFSFRLYSLTGTCVIENKKGNKTMDISQFPSGLYFIQGTDGTDNFTRKIVINR